MNRPAVHPGAGSGLHLLLEGGSALGLGDAALLARVVAGPGPAASAALDTLIRRHGPLVARVCHGILADPHAADDAVQATFLVLLRRAGAIRDPDRLAPWLYGVALRTAREARRRAPRTPSPTPNDEATMIDPTPDPSQTLIRREQADLLHGAIARLPRRYLAPVLLCEFEGLTHAEAAAQLGCPTSTVSIRLKRAREKLRAALARHRLDFETALLPVPLAAIPRTLAATAGAQLLAHRILWATSAAKWKAAIAAALVAGVAAVGAQGSQFDESDPKPAGVGAVTPLDRPQDPKPIPAPEVSPARPQGPPEPAPSAAPLEVAPGILIGYPTVRDVVDYQEYSGHVAASRTREIRSATDGIVSAVEVAEGDRVRAGQVLYRTVVEGNLEINLRVHADWQAMLKKADQIRSTTRSPGDPAEIAARAKAKDLKDALDNMATPVLAPFDGQIANLAVDVGFIVEAGKPLGTLMVVDPIFVDFAMDEQTFLKIRRWLAKRPETTHLPVRAKLSDEEDFPHAGRVLFRAARFNPATGTCTLHAELLNADHALIPGLFARVQVEYGDPHPVVLVPEAAFVVVSSVGEPLPSLANTRFIHVVDDCGLVTERRQIKIGQLRDGFREVVKGLDAKTRIVLGGAEAVQVGSTIPDAAQAPPR